MEDYLMQITNFLLRQSWHIAVLAVVIAAVSLAVKNIEDRIKTIMKSGKRFYRRPTFITIITVLLLAALTVPTTLALTYREKLPTLPVAASAERGDYGILMLDNYDPDYEGKEAYDDRLYLLDSTGKVKGVFSGFNICETFGGSHMLAVDEKRKTVWVAENVGRRLWHFDLRNGKLLQKIQGLKASALAVDPMTGNVWVTVSEGSIGRGHIKVLSPSGEIKAEYNIPGFDIACSSRDRSFWVVGKNIYKLDRKGKILGQIIDQIPWTAVSVSIDQKTGNAWVVVRAHPQVPGSKPEIWVVDRNVEIKQRLDLGELIPFCASVDSGKGVVWVGCLGTILRFTTDGEKLQSGRGVSAFSVVPGPSAESAFAASREGVTKIKVDESGYVSMGSICQTIDDQLGSSQKWLAIVPFADAKLRTSPHLTHLTLRQTAGEASEARLESAKELSGLGKVLLIYAHDHEEKYPDSLQELAPYDVDHLQWLIESVEYLGMGKTERDRPDTVIAYDKSLLELGQRTNVLFLDAHVAFETPEQLEKLGITKAEKSKAGIREKPVNSDVYKQLDEIVELSGLTAEMAFSEAIEVIRYSVEPPLKIVVLWRDLYENAEIERTTPINMDGISAVPLGVALKLLLKSVSGGFAELGYVVEDGVIIIATKESLPRKPETRTYDISDLTGKADDSGLENIFL